MGLPNVLFVGFQAPGTRGHAIQSGAKTVKIHGQQVPVLAHVETIENLSAHADYHEILGWLKSFALTPSKTFITHGELHASEALKAKIESNLGWDARVPNYLETVPL